MYGLEGYGSSDNEVVAQVQPEIEMATVASLPAAVAHAAARAAGAFARSLVDPVARATSANKVPAVAPPIAPLSSWRGLPKSRILGRGRASWQRYSATFPPTSLLPMAFPSTTAISATSLREFSVGGKAMPPSSGPGATRF
jgi:hypothetical protein